MISKKKRLQEFKIYGVTDLKETYSDIFQKAEKALKGGLDILQLRSKVLSDKELYDVGSRLKKLAQRYGALFFVNDRADICKLLDADGLHVGQDDLPITMLRKYLGSRVFIGKSTHSIEQARKTLKEDVDYIGFGPIFGTPTKPHYKPIGYQDIHQVMRLAKKPVVCIGGINLENAPKVLEAGAARLAVVRAIFESRDPQKAVVQFKELLNKQSA